MELRRKQADSKFTDRLFQVWHLLTKHAESAAAWYNLWCYISALSEIMWMIYLPHRLFERWEE